MSNGNNPKEQELKPGDVCPTCGQPVRQPAITLTTKGVQNMEQELNDEAARQAVKPGEK